MPESEVLTDFIPRVKLKDQSPAYKIFHYRFFCKVAQMHMYSNKYLSQFGFIDSGDPAVNRAMAHSLIDIQLTAATMAELHQEGVDITLTQPEDSVRIYQMIYDHLMDWQVRIRENVFITQAPMDDLRKLDALAGEIYKVARYYWKEKPYHGSFFQFLDNMGRSGIRRGTPVAPKPKGPVPEQKHTSIVDSIGTDLSKRQTPWR